LQAVPSVGRVSGSLSSDAVGAVEPDSVLLPDPFDQLVKLDCLLGSD
jgi:hypothetical protein